MCQSMPYLSLVGIQKWELINVSQKKKSRYKSRKRCEFLLSFFKDIFLSKIRLNLLFNFMNCVHLKQFVITRTFISNFKVIFLYWCFGQNIRSNEKWSCDACYMKPLDLLERTYSSILTTCSGNYFRLFCS